MVRHMTRLFAVALAAFLLLSARPAEAAKKFLDSDDAKEKDEPQKYLKDYDKLTKGKDADWVYFPEGASLKKGATVTVKEFEENGRGREARDAAREGKDYMEQWLEKQGFKVVKSGGEVTIEGNIFNAWEPHGARALLGRLDGQPGRGSGSRCQGRQREHPRGDPSQGQGFDDPGRGRERPGGRREGSRRAGK